jgi:hypothetical protein
VVVGRLVLIGEWRVGIGEWRGREVKEVEELQEKICHRGKESQSETEAEKQEAQR